MNGRSSINLSKVIPKKSTEVKKTFKTSTSLKEIKNRKRRNVAKVLLIDFLKSKQEKENTKASTESSYLMQACNTIESIPRTSATSASIYAKYEQQYLNLMNQKKGSKKVAANVKKNGLTQLPKTKGDNAMLSDKKKNDSVMKSAVMMRRMEYNAKLLQKKNPDPNQAILIQKQWRKYYMKEIMKRIKLIQREYRKYKKEPVKSKFKEEPVIEIEQVQPEVVITLQLEEEPMLKIEPYMLIEYQCEKICEAYKKEQIDNNEPLPETSMTFIKQSPLEIIIKEPHIENIKEAHIQSNNNIASNYNNSEPREEKIILSQAISKFSSSILIEPITELMIKPSTKPNIDYKEPQSHSELSIKPQGKPNKKCIEIEPIIETIIKYQLDMPIIKDNAQEPKTETLCQPLSYIKLQEKEPCFKSIIFPKSHEKTLLKQFIIQPIIESLITPNTKIKIDTYEPTPMIKSLLKQEPQLKINEIEPKSQIKKKITPHPYIKTNYITPQSEKLKIKPNEQRKIDSKLINETKIEQMKNSRPKPKPVYEISMKEVYINLEASIERISAENSLKLLFGIGDKNNKNLNVIGVKTFPRPRWDANERLIKHKKNLDQEVNCITRPIQININTTDHIIDTSIKHNNSIQTTLPENISVNHIPERKAIKSQWNFYSKKNISKLIKKIIKIQKEYRKHMIVKGFNKKKRNITNVFTRFIAMFITQRITNLYGKGLFKTLRNSSMKTSLLVENLKKKEPNPESKPNGIEKVIDKLPRTAVTTEASVISSQGKVLTDHKQSDTQMINENNNNKIYLHIMSNSFHSLSDDSSLSSLEEELRMMATNKEIQINGFNNKSSKTNQPIPKPYQKKSPYNNNKTQSYLIQLRSKKIIDESFSDDYILSDEEDTNK